MTRTPQKRWSLNMPTDHRHHNGEGEEMVKIEGVQAHPSPKLDSEHPGYEIQDVNVGGIITFLAGLSGFIVIFFFVCWLFGKGFNSMVLHEDGQPNKWQANLSQPGAALRGEKREDLRSNAEMEQKQLQAVTQTFPSPRLESDDGNQDTADLHAREDLLLNYYSSSADLPGGAIRIPINRAMELIVQRGLGGSNAAGQAPTKLMAGESAPVVTAPLTDGFARTGYELETIEAREQKLEFTKASKE